MLRPLSDNLEVDHDSLAEQIKRGLLHPNRSLEYKNAVEMFFKMYVKHLLIVSVRNLSAASVREMEMPAGPRNSTFDECRTEHDPHKTPEVTIEYVTQFFQWRSHLLIMVS